MLTPRPTAKNVGMQTQNPNSNGISLIDAESQTQVEKRLLSGAIANFSTRGHRGLSEQVCQEHRVASSYPVFKVGRRRKGEPKCGWSNSKVFQGARKLPPREEPV